MVPYGTSAMNIGLWDGVVYTDLTRRMVRRGGGTSLFDTPTAYLYIGHLQRFDNILFWLTVVGQYTDLIWECWNGTEWIEWIPIQTADWEFRTRQGRVSLDLRGLGLNEWTPSKLVDTSPSITQSLDGVWYWIRVHAENVLETAQADAITIRPYSSVATPHDLQHQLQYSEPFTSDTIPSFETIEGYIRESEDDIFRLTGHYYRPEFVEGEMLDFKPYGMTLRHRPILDIMRLDVWDGSDWAMKEQGREGEWHFEEHTGLLYLSTIFLDTIPPMLRRGYSSRRQQGLFKRGVRVSYVHGHDSRIDSFAGEVARTAIKQAAVDVVMDRDFASLIPSNLDRISLSEKVKLWREDVSEFKDRYAKLVMF